MNRYIMINVLLCLIISPYCVNGFITPFNRHDIVPVTSTSSVHLFDPTNPFSQLDSFNTNNIMDHSFWISTIDGDIAKIPDNEFATVFAGGIVVMLGGLLSAVIVGAILEKGDLYANLAAESYIQNEDDAEFWKNLSEEEKKKAQSMLSKIKEAKEGGITDETELKDAVFSAIEDQSNPTTSNTPVVATPQSKKTEQAAKASSDMFSDYGD